MVLEEKIKYFVTYCSQTSAEAKVNKMVDS